MFGLEQNLFSEVDLSGIFIAQVVDNADPKCLERIRIRVLGVHDMFNEDKENSIWANHIKPSKSNSGEIPDLNDYVYVLFLKNDPMHPLWLGWVAAINN